MPRCTVPLGLMVASSTAVTASKSDTYMTLLPDRDRLVVSPSGYTTTWTHRRERNGGTTGSPASASAWRHWLRYTVRTATRPRQRPRTPPRVLP